MPISDARENFAEVVNRAVYGGEPTYITRRGRRLALVVSAAQLHADRARVHQQAVVETCEHLWAHVVDKDEATQAVVRGLINQTIEAAEDVGDLAALLAADEERESGAEPPPWEQVKVDLGL